MEVAPPSLLPRRPVAGRELGPASSRSQNQTRLLQVVASRRADALSESSITWIILFRYDIRIFRREQMQRDFSFELIHLQQCILQNKSVKKFLDKRFELLFCSDWQQTELKTVTEFPWKSMNRQFQLLIPSFVTFVGTVQILLFNEGLESFLCFLKVLFTDSFRQLTSVHFNLGK